MRISTLFVFIIFSSVQGVNAGNGLNKLSTVRYFPSSTQSIHDESHTSRFNVKLQPAIYWATLGLEAEYVVSPKVTVALNVMGKLGNIDSKQNVSAIKQEEFLNNGYMAELIGRYYIALNKKKLTLAPMGFYVQAAVGFNKLLYFDGSTRPFSLFTRHRSSDDPRKPSDFAQPSPIIGGIGAGYQVELLPKKVIANVLLGTQTNFDDNGVFISVYVSPSIGLMF